MDTPTPRRPVVVIVGRPNVGKSALFNRLAGGRIAIVHAESGVTRDRLLREVRRGGKSFELADTGGITNLDDARARDAVQAGVRRQVDAALADASAAILVVDVQAGLAPLDEEAARLLRAGGCFAVVAANKADDAAMDLRAAEFARLGFPVFPVSALHNRGLDALMAPVLRALPVAPERGAVQPLRLTVAGRPNVGKSSYINRLLRHERVIVAPLPGTTRDSIDIPFAIGRGARARHYVLTDTAGLRPKPKVHAAVEHFSTLRAEHSVAAADVVALMLDAVQGPTAQDKKIAALIHERGKGCVLLVNKWDLVGGSQRAYADAVLRAMPFLADCPLVFVSAKTGLNIRRSIEAVEHVAAQVQLRLPTGVLNRTLLEAWRAVQPPLVRGRRLKIFYASQVGTRPVRVRLFVNDPKLVPAAYGNYLVRKLRAKFGLEGAPVRLHFTGRERCARADGGG